MPFPVHLFQNDLDPGTVKARFQVGPIDPTIVYVGDLAAAYGSDLLVKAMPAILKNHTQARLVIVGQGSEYWPMRVYSRYLLLDHAIRFAGDLQGPPLFELIQAADIVAVPSREPTPWWPILAAWAARRPVVASHQAAVPLLEHDHDSILVYPNEGSLVWGIEPAVRPGPRPHARPPGSREVTRALRRERRRRADRGPYAGHFGLRARRGLSGDRIAPRRAVRKPTQPSLGRGGWVGGVFPAEPRFSWALTDTAPRALRR